MPEYFKERIHFIARYNKSGWGLIFTDRDNKAIDEYNDVDYDPNEYRTPEDGVFELDDYVSNNFPAGMNDGDDTYENTYDNPNYSDAN